MGWGLMVVLGVVWTAAGVLVALALGGSAAAGDRAARAAMAAVRPGVLVTGGVVQSPSR